MESHDPSFAAPQRRMPAVHAAMRARRGARAIVVVPSGRSRITQDGVIGRCAIDFVMVGGRAYAIEVNLRKGGTTHPFAALELLTGGAYDAEAASFTTPDGAAKHDVASDHVGVSACWPRCSSSAVPCCIC